MKKVSRALYVLILAGGGGSRLWPLSRAEMPKPFLKWPGNSSPFQQCLDRALQVTPAENILVIAGLAHKNIVQDQVLEKNRPGIRVICEPDGKDTGPAIALGMAKILQTGGTADSLCLVCPSDHWISDEAGFAASVEKAKRAAETGYLTVFGLSPAEPDPNFGYLVPGEPAPNGFTPVTRYVEKPDVSEAERLIRSGALWNSGLFCFSIGTMVRCMERFFPPAGRLLNTNFDTFLAGFASLPRISIDRAVMEKADCVTVVPLLSDWADGGTWGHAFKALGLPEEGGCRVTGPGITEGCKRCLVVASGNRTVALAGVSDAIVVDTPDALLVASGNADTEIHSIVKKLVHENRGEIFDAFHGSRPWGEYTILCRGDGFKVKKIMVRPGARLSLQSHRFRSEHWVVLYGSALVTVNGSEELLASGESAFIVSGAIHRLENPDVLPLEIIEVQSGSYLGEDDIVRYEDDYFRASPDGLPAAGR